MPPAGLHVLVIDEQPTTRRGVASLLGEEIDGVTVTGAADLPEAIGRSDPASAGVVVLDPGGDLAGIDAAVADLARRFGGPVVVFTAGTGTRALADALKAGVKGFVCKDSPPADLVRAVRAAAAGDFYVDPALSSALVLDEGDRTLTPRQREILQLLADGVQTAVVGERLGLATETVRTHIKRILAKLDANTRTQAVAIALRAGVIE
ncbi:MAG: response regulator transcription factor [Thermoleophilaceae bacterium]|nr:response regulator transcription factor [Thermoleophilaceae bacterium]